MPTEAERESGEFVAEVARLRPHWLKQEPDQRAIAELESFWKTRVWRAARDEAAGLLAGRQRRAAQSELLLREQRQQQAEWRSAGFFRTLEEVPKAIRLRRLIPPPDGEADAIAEGWQPGTVIEPWRLENLGIFWQALFTVRRRAPFTGEDTTYADWVGAYVDLDVACSDRADFGRMWLYEMDDAAMLRCWLRWAVRYGQHASKIGPGNPVDEQYSSYLPDADIFATADRRFARVINVVRPEAPRRCAVAAFVDIGSQKGGVTEAISDALEAARSSIS